MSKISTLRIILFIILIILTSLLIFFSMPGILSIISFMIALFSSLFTIVFLSFSKKEITPPISLLLFLFSVPLVLGFITFLEGILNWVSIFGVLTAWGLTITFWSNFVMVPLSYIHLKMEEKDAMKEIKEYPPITIIIPAYNEEKVISMTLKALLEADYPSPKQIIVIDDGSSDRTSIVAREFEKYGVMVYRKPNGGKSSAINCGLLFTKYPIVVTLDADTIIGRDSLKYLVRPLLNPEVAGVASNALVLNKVNLLTKCQALEYIININIIRRAMALLGKVPIIPGVLGAHRKDFLDYLGRYDHDTITEDFDVTIKYLKVGKVVLASHYAKAFTEAPTTLRDFYRQRMRWYRGNIQTVIKHRDVFKTRKYGALYFLVYPFLIINLFINPILSYINWIMAAISIFMGYWQMIVTLISLFIVLQVLFSLLALEYSEEEDNSLLLISPLFVVGYKHLIDFLMIKAGMDIFFKRKVTWTRARRYGIYAKT